VRVGLLCVRGKAAEAVITRRRCPGDAAAPAPCHCLIIASAADVGAVERLRQPNGLLSTGPAEFQQYFNRRLLQLMCDNCAAGRSTWTNNNCESINHVLKQAVQWRRNQLPELIHKLMSLQQTWSRTVTMTLHRPIPS